MTSQTSQTSGNVSVVLNYSAHEIFSDYADRDGYVQLTRSAGRAFIVVDGKPVGSVSTEEFARAEKLFAPATRPVCRTCGNGLFDCGLESEPLWCGACNTRVARSDAKRA